MAFLLHSNRKSIPLIILFSSLRSTSSVSACLTVTAMTFDANGRMMDEEKGPKIFFSVGKFEAGARLKTIITTRKSGLMTKHYFFKAQVHRPPNRISDCSHPWHLIRKRSFLLSCSLVQKLNSCITLLIVEYLTSLPACLISIPFGLVSFCKELFASFVSLSSQSRSSIWFHTFMDQKYDCCDRDKEPFYWFHVSPYCILWAVSELTIFSLVSYRAFLISHKQQKQRRFCRFVFLAALCATRMKFIASNMRFHTTSWQCTVGVPAEFHITGIKTTATNTFFHLASN